MNVEDQPATTVVNNTSGVLETPGLGNVVKSSKIRSIIYGTYTGAALLVGAVAAYFVSTGQPLPIEVTGATGVITFLAIPVGGLAAANVPSK